MKNKTIIERLDAISEVDNSWMDDVLFYEQNKEWLDRSAKIAVKILRKLRENRLDGKFPSSQKDLAEIMNVSPQQINKIVKGTENLTLETISRIEEAIAIKLMAVNEEDNKQYATINAISTVTTISTTMPVMPQIVPSNDGGFMLLQTVSKSYENTHPTQDNTSYAMAA